jgi:hypothetical protein
MMGGTFIIDAIVVGGNFKEISILMHLGLWRNSLNNSLLGISLTVLLLQASYVASSSNRFFGIHGHPSSVTHNSVHNPFPMLLISKFYQIISIL